MMTTIVEGISPDTVFHSIYHISDIHIRLYSRKEEYNYVFEQLYETLRAHPRVSESIIVITGDILHNKIDLTPECILMTWHFLKSLGEICPTVLIAGNHDALLNNRERLDSLTSILQERNPRHVFYLKRSGYYRFGNIIFTVNSLLDESDAWLDVLDEMEAHASFFKDCHRIALYHGQIAGWTNNFGFVSESGERVLADFKGYDFVLLGDIHKHQFMDKEKKMAYAGSLISQNFGETDDDHGVLIWDLERQDTEFVRINNPYRFCEGRLDADRLIMRYTDEEIVWTADGELAKHLPPFSNLRVYLTDNLEWNHSFMSRFKQERPQAKLQPKYEMIKTTMNKKSPDKKNVQQLEMNNDTFWIRSFIHEKLEGNDILVVEHIIEVLLEEYRKNISFMNINDNRSWELKRLEFDNMFGYGNRNTICFQDLYPFTITGIFGRNSFGKSTIIDIITFLLFGKITRSNHGNSIPKEIINVNEKSSRGEIVFAVGNQEYKIVKVCTRQKNDKIKISEHLYKKIDNEWNDFSEEHRKKTDRIIDQLLGNMESFLFTNVSLQQRERQFREMTQKDRKEFLYALFGLDWFEKYRKAQEDDFKKLKGEEKVYKEKIGNDYQEKWDAILGQIQEKINQETQDIGKLEEAIEILLQDSRRLMEDKKVCPYGNEDEIMKDLDCVNKEIDSLATYEKHLAHEKHILAKHRDDTNVYEIRQEMDVIQKQKEEYQRYETMMSSENTEIRKWMNCDRSEWIAYQAVIKEYSENSEKITNEWMDEKSAMEEKIQTLKMEESQYDEQFVSINEWESLHQKIVKIEREIPLLEQKISQKIDEIPENLENLFEQFKETLHKYEMIQCTIRLLKNNLKETKRVEYNKDCASCMNNPFYLKMNQIENDLDQHEKENQNIVNRLQELKAQFSESPDENDFEKIKDAIARKVNHLKKNRDEQLKKRESMLKKLDMYKNDQQKYNHTRLYIQSQKSRDLLCKLEKSLHNHPLKTKYDKLMFIVKNMSIYQSLESFWKHYQQDSRLCDVEDRLQDLHDQLEHYSSISAKIETINEQIMDCHSKKIRIEMERSQLLEYLNNFRYNKKANRQKEELEKNITQSNFMKKEKTKMLHSLHVQFAKAQENQKEWAINMQKWVATREGLRSKELMIQCIDRDGLPLYLLKMFLPTIENEMNQLLQTFLDRNIALRVSEKDIVIGLESNQHCSAYLGGMEAFIVDLSLKLVFSKYSKQPKSNFFIIDEGISVFDQERISNIGILFNFLSSISEHILLISHLPTIKDYVTQSIEVLKDEDGKSYLVFH